MQLRALCHPDFRNLWLGQFISQIGDAFYFLLFGFMVDQLTKDSRMVSMVMLVQGLPYIFLTPYAGVLADRLDRRRILIFCDLLSTLILVGGAVVQYLRGLTITEIFVVAGSLSVINAFFVPAKNASIGRLVPPEEINDANSISLATQNVAPLIGILGSTAVMAAFERAGPARGFSAAMSINALSFLLSAFFIARLPKLVALAQTVRTEGESDLRAGWNYLRTHRILLTIVLLSFGTTLMIGGFYPIYLAANRQWFGGTYAKLALLEATFFVCMIVASLWVGRHPVRRLGLSFGIPVVAIGILVAGMMFGRNFTVFVLLNALCGLFVPYLQIPISNFVQLTVPDDVRGRVFGFMSMASMGATPLSLVMFGLLIEGVGLANSFLISGLGFAIVGVLALSLREFRQSEIKTPASTEAGVSE